MLDQLINTFPTIVGFSDIDIPVIAIIGGLSIAAIAIIFGTISTIFTKREQEQTKREIAAYVAEGTISPEDAERIIKSKPRC